MRNDFFLGASAHTERIDLLKDVGIECIHAYAHTPPSDKNTSAADHFDSAMQRLRELNDQGFSLCVVTPSPKRLHTGGEQAIDDAYFERYREGCRVLAAELKGKVLAWQVGNEANLPYFRGALSVEQVVRYMQAGARGIKDVDPDASIGINMASGDEPLGYEIIDRTYSGEPELFDHVGIDGYFGSWEEGGPETWDGKLDVLHRKTRKPIIVQEFGYPSRGEVMTHEERTCGTPMMALGHELRKWPYMWEQGFSPEAQAEFLRRAVGVFESKQYVRGAFWFRWNDGRECWYCHRSDCPCETVWGLVTVDEEPKPAYYAFKEVSRSKGERT